MYGRCGPVAPPPIPPEVASFSARLETLELACAGLWEFLKAKHGYTDAELIEVIQQVDARDGVVDGKIGSVDEGCPYCGRKLLTKQRHHCVWCGAELAKKPC